VDEVSALPPENPVWVLLFQEADRLETVDPLGVFARGCSRVTKSDKLIVGKKP
jgi:hypothetical protein